MTSQSAPSKVLILVKTYPQPSIKYRETVCTAGITETGKWVRLYPIPFRYLPQVSQFGKYQWVSVQLGTQRASNDPRPESRRPFLETIRPIGETLSTARSWEQRRAAIAGVPQYTLNQLKTLYTQDRTSLGIVRPSRILDVEVKAENAEWKPRIQRMFDQLPLFGEGQKPLRKLPFTFRYVFECPDSSGPHKAQIIDWELGALFNKEVTRLKSETAAAQSVRMKFLNDLADETRETLFFMGTKLPYNTWMVLGVFYPKLRSQRWSTRPLW